MKNIGVQRREYCDVDFDETTMNWASDGVRWVSRLRRGGAGGLIMSGAESMRLPRMARSTVKCPLRLY